MYPIETYMKILLYTYKMLIFSPSMTFERLVPGLSLISPVSINLIFISMNVDWVMDDLNVLIKEIANL